MSITLGQRQCEFTHALALLIIHAASKGLHVKIQELNRTIQTQKEYVAGGVSKTLDSRHLDKLAADIYIYDLETKAPTANKELYRGLAEYWESLGGRAGFRFGLEHLTKTEQNAKIGWDPYHFEFVKISVTS